MEDRKGILQFVRLLEVGLNEVLYNFLFFEKKVIILLLGEMIRRNVIKLRIERWREEGDEKMNVVFVLSRAILNRIGVLLRGLFIIFIRNSILNGQLIDFD